MILNRAFEFLTSLACGWPELAARMTTGFPEENSGGAVRDLTKCFLSLQTLLQLLNELAVARSPTFEVL
jgi:hypothetical protein